MSMLFTTLAWSISGSSQMDWLPQRGWTYTGGDWTIVVSGSRAVIVETRSADLAKLWKAMGIQ
jgi:roadblock/LC7 domain-containing protein